MTVRYAQEEDVPKLAKLHQLVFDASKCEPLGWKKTRDRLDDFEMFVNSFLMAPAGIALACGPVGDPCGMMLGELQFVPGCNEPRAICYDLAVEPGVSLGAVLIRAFGYEAAARGAIYVAFTLPAKRPKRSERSPQWIGVTKYVMLTPYRRRLDRVRASWEPELVSVGG